MDPFKAGTIHSDDVKTKIFSNMSNRASKMLKEDIELQKTETPYAVKEFQDKILKIIYKLADAGEIVFHK